jgi:hypothetical protein
VHARAPRWSTACNQYPDAAEHLEEAKPDLLAFTTFPWQLLAADLARQTHKST